MTFLAHIADRVLNRPLMISPDKAAVIVGVLSGRIGVGSPEASRFEGDVAVQRDEQGNPKSYEPFRVSGGVGIVTITGSLVNRGAWVGASSGLTSYEGIQHQLKRAAAHADVKSIILDIHSPGGEAVGAFETAAMVREISATKPVVAVVNGIAASAAYAIASGAREIVTTESGISGSIGVVWLHADYSQYLANEGIKPTFIFAGAHKVDGHPFGPLPEAVQADIQAEINAVYDQFLRTVASGRGARMTLEMARATEARTMAGAAAVAAGLADRVGTFESVLQDLTRAAGRNSSMKGRSMTTEPNSEPAAQAPAGITKAQLDAAVAEATAKGRADAEASITAERTRMAALDDLAAKAGPAAAEIIKTAKADGSSVEAAALKIFAEGKHLPAAVIAGLAADDKTAAAAAPAAPGQVSPAGAQTADGWKAEWEKSEKLKGEFVSADAYVAFKTAEASGRVRMLKGRDAA